MKRKIAAIFAADVAGYSRLVAEDEEETLRRLQAYRAVIDEFIAASSGRIFNTAGDAVLAEFSSAVEAVRCAIDIQESLRTRNRAYPPSRQMNFRIGITIGDVVERDGDLLGDGVNIAARLESIAPVGGICVSRTVFEQVANKLSVQFADIGEQQVKNIPNPVHAFTVAVHGDPGMPTPAKKAAEKKKSSLSPLVLALAALAIAVLGVGGYYAMDDSPKKQIVAAAPSTSQIRAPSSSEPTASQSAPRNSAAAPEQPQPPQQEKLIPEKVPIVSDRFRTEIRDEYLPAPGHKALAVSARRIAFLTNQPDERTASNGALATCQRLTDDSPGPPQRCELFAVGDVVVSSRAHPPLPPQPWLMRNPSAEMPFAAKDVPLVNEGARNAIEKFYVPGRGPKALALSPRGNIGLFFNQSSTDEAVRRALEFCGINAGVPCAIVAVDNMFTVPVPMTMKVVGFFRPSIAPGISVQQREEIGRKLAEGPGGWSAVAIGNAGNAGVVRASKEADAISGAVADCQTRDQNCRVVAVNIFMVEPK
ncbi:MAG TPA: adenylate/guanylate cyclase domain-containing protein [Xanthobacteraceae bacterium]|nr:adenylate/guanylate cyclase domain-containing protein [Xanthobacteraceae bacterium]